ncbi:caspase-2-like isoform X2 [Pomacea canaliculata]|uniref:caspase-2-like isoform X2 n=1 Tax=Pomacea canaliculata TaxID=400727 RepID=UPI000D732065|nr:caspase-2-like isoform X2 [Pomacea canaliculata]
MQFDFHRSIRENRNVTTESRAPMGFEIAEHIQKYQNHQQQRMEKVHRDLLVTHRTELVENIDVTNGLFSELVQRKVLNQRMVRNIKNNKDIDTQIEELLDILPRRGPDAFHLFCESLIASDQQHIVDSILKVNLAEAPTEKTASSCTVCTVHSSPHVSSMATDTSCLTATTSLSITSATSAALQQPSSPQKRGLKDEKKAPVESAEDLASETESDCSPRKIRSVKSDSPSVICIKDGDDKSVFRICHSKIKEKPSELISQKQLDKNRFTTDEMRYVMKHFVTVDSQEERRQEVNRNLAETLLHDMTRDYFNAFQSQPRLYPKNPIQASDNHRYVSSLRESLSRCDSADTMDRHFPQKAGATCHQTDKDETVSVLMPPQTTQALHLSEKNMDLTDGSVCVRVEHCNRQFYMENKEKAYRMLGMPRGQALIINVNEVHDKPPRRGTDIDRDNMHNLLTQLHFNVIVYNDCDDLTAQGLVNKLRKFAALPAHHTSDACIICLLSHGEEGFIFGTDGKRVPLDEIFVLFGNRHCPALLSKPKIFFIQACRGGALDHGVKLDLDETDGPSIQQSHLQLPSVSDMLICYPTLEGYYAWRNRERGSWYIQAVVQIFMRHAKCEDICAMLNRVNELVSRKVSRCPQADMDRMSQMSEFKSSLRRPYLFFFPGIGSPHIDNV